MKNIILIIKGAIIGLANIIPGLSGGTLAISLNIYEELIYSINNLFVDFKKSITYLSKVLVGMIISIVLLSHVMIYLLDHFEVLIVCLFVGLILGGVPLIIKKGEVKFSKKNLLISLFTFGLIILIPMLAGEASLVDLSVINISVITSLLLVGIISSSTMVVPGISGSMILIMIGFYEPILTAIKELSKFNNIQNNLVILFSFGIGVLIGIFLISKLISFLFIKNKELTYSAILGIVLASAVLLIISISNYELKFINALISILFIDLGFIVAYLLGGRE